MSYGIFIDTTRCIACKGCQVACKQWNRLPAEPTDNLGNLQNPPDFSYTTYKLVRMREQIMDGQVRWLFFPDQCRHCLVAPCLLRAGNTDAIYQDRDTGAVIHTSDTKALNSQEITAACPYNIPRSNKDGVLAKCTMCNDRIKRQQEPACVKACPTDCLNFGELEDMHEMADRRLKKVKSAYPDARLLDSENVRVIFLTAYTPHKYHDYAISFDPKLWSAQ